MALTLHVRELRLPLRHPFTIKHGTTTLQRNLLVSLSDGIHTGYGETASSRAHASFTVEAMQDALEKARPLIESTPLDEPAAFWRAIQPALADNPFALCSVDEAAHDLWGRRLGQPVWKLWGLNLTNLPVSNYTVGIAPIDEMVAKMREFDGWPIYKIKLGTDHDLEIVRELRRHTDAVFRIDANTAWTVEQTLQIAPELAKMGVEFIEQPLPRDDWDGMRRLAAAGCPLPLMADESCRTENDVARCAESFDGINIKLTKAGGLTPARRMIAEARDLGLKVMVGCMNESSVGISAIGQLLPLLDYVDMDGSVLIAEDIADGVHLDRGIPIFPDIPGHGITLHSDFDAA